MTNAWAYGGLWPDDGMDADDVLRAIFEVRYPVGHPDRERLSPHLRPRRPATPPERDGSIWFQSPLAQCDFGISWSFDGWFTGGDDFFAGHSLPTARHSRDRKHAQQVRDGKKPAWDMEFDWFPFHQEVYVNGPEVEGWSVHEEYFWLARNLYIPRGWASFLYFWLEEPHDVWATAPGLSEPIKLPDDFRLF